MQCRNKPNFVLTLISLGGFEFYVLEHGELVRPGHFCQKQERVAKYVKSSLETFWGRLKWRSYQDSHNGENCASNWCWNITFAKVKVVEQDTVHIRRRREEEGLRRYGAVSASVRHSCPPYSSHDWAPYNVRCCNARQSVLDSKAVSKQPKLSFCSFDQYSQKILVFQQVRSIVLIQYSLSFQLISCKTSLPAPILGSDQYEKDFRWNPGEIIWWGV